MSLLTLSRSCLRSVIAQTSRPVVVLTQKFTSKSSSLGATEKKHQRQRPTPSFLQFQKDNTDKVRKENPDLKYTTIRKLLADQWANSDPGIKEYYAKEYRQQREDYKAPFKKLPRKPPSTFGLYVKENFASIKEENKDMAASDVTRKLAAKWRNLSWEEKEEIRKKTEEAQKQYEVNILEFEDQLSEEEREFLNDKAHDKMKELKVKKKKLLNFPKQPRNAFFLFWMMERENFPRVEGESMTQWMKQMGARWRSMAEEEKEMYRVAQRTAEEKYHEDVALWKEKHENKL